MLAVGTTFGAYEVLAKLKAGGMATLFLARRVGAAGFRRHVAIKVVHEHLASDASFVRMFVDEALLQSRIHHPNVVHVEELGERDGQHFLVMEYVHGCSLAQLMTHLAKRDRRLTPEMACSVASQVLAGLHAAHELRDEAGALLGVVHRDVSPQNVLLAYEGHVKLIDFGVAKAKNRQSTVGGSLKGKLRYMAPEQAFGRPVDRRCDVYALGIVLWELLTMRRLFHAEEDLALLDLVRNPQVEPPSKHSPGIPPALDAVVLKALAPSPDDRYASAQDMRRALAEALPGALLVDASNLAELLAAVMHDAIERDRAQLPGSVSAVIANVGRKDAVAERGDEALKTMTISAAGISYLVDAEGESGSEGASRGARPSSTPVLVSGAPDAGAVSIVAPPMAAPTAELPVDAPPRRRWVIAAGLALAVLVGAGAIALTRGGGEGEQGIVATPLAPEAQPGSGAPAPAPEIAAPPVEAVTAPEPAPEAVAAPVTPEAEEVAREPEVARRSAAAPAEAAPAVEPPAPVRAREERPRTRPRSSAGRRGPVPLVNEF